MSQKILLVEDEALIAMNEAQMLKKHGYEVVTAYNGEKAIEAVDSDPDISLILMDIDLGKGMDGTEAAEQILNKKDIPVVFLSSHTEPEVVEKTDKITSYGYVVKNSGETVLLASIKMAFRLFEAKNEAKKHEKALRESEATIRKKLKAITEPEGDIGTLELADIIDVEELQHLMEDIFKVSKVGGAILDVSGKILVCTTMEDICRKFHRVHPDTAKNCLESDLALAGGVPAGTYKAYRCKNNMWDMVTPLEIGGKHLGNIYIGQFFFAEEDVDYEVFRKQARQHGFDESEYLAALDRVPRLKRETVDRAMAFYSRLAGMISSLSYTTIKLSRNLVQHKQAEERLKESEGKFRAFVENANDIIYQLTPEGVFTYVSPNWTEVLGYRQEEVIGEKVEKFVHPDDLQLCIDFLNNVLVTGAKQSGVEYMVKHKNGTWRWHSSNGAPIKDENGKIISYIGIGRDITKRKRMEKDLRQSEERARVVIETAEDSIFIKDTGGVYTMVNPAMEKLFGCESQDIIGKTDYELFGEEAGKALNEADMAVVYEGQIVEEFPVKPINGILHAFHTIKVPLHDSEGTITGLCGIARDITERKLAEEKLREALKEKEFLMKELNHRVKNNLLMISSLINLKDPETEADFADIKHQIGVISLIHEKLYQTESVTEISCRDYFGELLNSIFSSFSIYQVRIESNIDAVSIPVKSAMSLGLIINELATNAIKHGFTDAEEAVFSVTMKEDKENSRYELTISNTGNPFPENIDVDNPQTIGLRLISALTDQLGGTIDLKRELHPVFILRFPIEEG